MSDFLHPAENTKKPAQPAKKGTVGKKTGAKGAAPSPPSFSGVNLMSEESLKRSVSDQKKKSLATIGWSVVAAVSMSAIAFVGVKAYGLIVLQHERELAVDLGQADTAIAELEGNSAELNAFTQKLEILKSLFENHLYYTQFIAALEKHTLPSVTYGGLSVAPASAISLSATAPDFQTLARQLRIYQENAKDLMSSVMITSGHAELNQEGAVAGVSFEVSFTMNPAILKKSGGAGSASGGK